MLRKQSLMFLTFLLVSGIFFFAATEESHSGVITIGTTCCQLEGSCYDNSKDGGALACPNGVFVENAICDEADGVCVAQSAAANPIPTLSEWGLIAMAGVLGIAGYIIVRRRRVIA